MKRAYIDTSWLIRINFEDPDKKLQRELKQYKRLFAAELLIAELFAFARRESLEQELITEQLRAITFIIPDRSLKDEMERIIKIGYLRGADLWHLACACYLSPKPEELSFLSADDRQREVAETLGFEVLKT